MSGCYGYVLCIKVVVITRIRTPRLARSIEIRVLEREGEREIRGDKTDKIALPKNSTTGADASGNY